MIASLVREMGPWAWWIFGAILLAAEILVPGNFLVWIGLAALTTGILSNFLWSADWWSWEVQWLVFAGLAVVSVLIGRRWLLRHGNANEEPTLNRRTESLIGRTADLYEPIVNGRGRIRIGDTMWMVEGADAPAGTRVKVVGSSGSDLRVEAI
jgi:membrane protein implicated in regulation of membrane protease activity